MAGIPLSNGKTKYNYDADRLFVIYPYRAKSTSELSLSFGDEVIPLHGAEYDELWLVAFPVPDKNGRRLQGNVPRLHLTKGFYKYSWFVGSMTCAEAVNELVDNEDREFLVRISELRRPTDEGPMGQLVFTYKDKTCIRHATIHHVKNMDEKGYFYVTCLDTINYSPFVDYYSATLKDLVDYLESRLTSGQLFLASQLSLVPTKSKFTQRSYETLRSDDSSRETLISESVPSFVADTESESVVEEIVVVENTVQTKKHYTVRATEGLEMMIAQSSESFTQSEKSSNAKQPPPKPPRVFDRAAEEETTKNTENKEKTEKRRYSERAIDVPEHLLEKKENPTVTISSEEEAALNEISKIFEEIEETIGCKKIEKIDNQRKSRENEEALHRLRQMPFTVSATKLHEARLSSPQPSSIEADFSTPGIPLMSEENAQILLSKEPIGLLENRILKRADEVEFLEWQENPQPRMTIESSVDSLGSPVKQPLWLTIPPSINEEVITVHECEIKGKKGGGMLAAGTALLVQSDENNIVLVQKIEDGDMGYVKKADISEPVEKMPKISRTEGDRRFAEADNPVGSFYIRQKGDNEWVLVVKNSHRGSCDHYRITWKDGYYVLSNDLFFQSLHLLVDYFTENRYTRRSKRLPLELKQLAVGTCKNEKEETKSNVVSITQRRVALMEKISEGSYAEIYIALLDGYEKVTAKVLECKEIGRFRRESELLSQLRHPSIVVLKATCFSQPPYLFLMEFMNRSLYDLLKLRRLNSDFGEYDIIAAQICSAMLYLGSRSIVHRNLKASNVLCNNAESNPPRVKLADFSLAIFEGEADATELERLPINWTAPECLRGDSATCHSDVWSFGVLLCEMANEGVIEYSESDPQKLSSLLEKGARLQRPKGVSDDLWFKIEECWQLRPKRRISFKQLFDFFDNSFVYSQLPWI